MGAPSLAEALQREFFSLMKAKIHAHLSVYKPFPTRLNIGEPTARFAKWNKIEFDCTPSLFGALFPASAHCVQLQPREDFRPTSPVILRCIDLGSVAAGPRTSVASLPHTHREVMAISKFRQP